MKFYDVKLLSDKEISEMEFIGKRESEGFDKEEILSEYDELQISKLRFLNECYSNSATMFSMWRTYNANIYSVEKMLEKDLAYFNATEKQMLIDRAYGRSESTKNLMRVFINYYSDWSKKTSSKVIGSNTKVTVDTSEETKRRMLRSDLLDLKNIYRLVDKSKETTYYSTGIMILLYRYGITGKKSSWALNLRFKHIDAENRVVNIVDEESVKLITKIPVDDLFIEYIEEYYKSLVSEGVGISSYVLMQKQEPGGKVNLQLANTRLVLFASKFKLKKRLSANNLKLARIIELTMNIKLQTGSVYSSDILKLIEIMYGEPKSISVKVKIADTYRLITDDFVLSDAQFVKNKKLKTNDDIIQSAHKNINFIYRPKDFMDIDIVGLLKCNISDDNEGAFVDESAAEIE